MPQNNLKEKIKTRLPETATFLLGFLPPIAVSLFDSLGLVEVIEKAGSVPFAKPAMFLLSLLLWSWTYFLIKRPRYTFYPELGVKGDIDKNIFLCTSCNHFLRIEADCLRCIACEKSIPSPEEDILDLILSRKIASLIPPKLVLF